MSCDDVLYILSYFEGRIDIYECIYYYKNILNNNEDIYTLNNHINYLEGKIDSGNLNSDYMVEVEYYLLNAVCEYLKLKSIDIDINLIDIIDIKKLIVGCR